MNTAKCKRFRDVYAAPGSQLFQALEDGDRKKAAAIYDECERLLAKEQGRFTYYAADGALRVTATGARSISDDVDE